MIPAPYTSGKCPTTEPHPQFPAFSLGPSEVRIKNGAPPETEVAANTAGHLRLNHEDSTAKPENWSLMCQSGRRTTQERYARGNYGDPLHDNTDRKMTSTTESIPKGTQRREIHIHKLCHHSSLLKVC